jgi:small-conductance mechanosensitive channel
MEKLTALTASNLLMAWLIPIVAVVLATALGWLAERLTIRWVKGIAGRGDPARELVITRTLRGHITFWGLLLGLSFGLKLLFSNPATKSIINTYIPTLGEWYPNALKSLFIMSLTIMLARMAVMLIHASTASAARPVVSLVSNVAWFVTFAIGFMLVLSQFQINIAPWLAALGVAGLAVSLALQATLTDLISGMLLLGTRQIEVGNYIKLSSGEEGYVADINWRTTTIRQLGNNQIIVPNSKMTQSSVTNYHMPQPNSSVTVDVGVSYGSDLDHVERVTVEVGREVMREVKGGVPDFTPVVRFNALGDYSVRFTVALQAAEFTDQYLIKSEFIKRLRARYHQEGISIPIPIQTVRISDAAAGSATASPTPGPAVERASAPNRSRGPAKATDGAKRRG